uniref:Uncharacterized protein n=1 Tax=Agrobacterium albertimagni TaxID=147266 RepID=A0A7C1TA47_9HYPH
MFWGLRQHTTLANQIKQWKDQLFEEVTGVFGDASKAEPVGPAVDVKTQHAKIDELTLESDFLSGAPGQACVSACKIDPISGVIGVQF